MTIEVRPSGIAALIGVCPVDDAEPLLLHLVEHPGSPIDWTECAELHTAVFQVILAARAPLIGEPASPFLRAWSHALLASEPP